MSNYSYYTPIDLTKQLLRLVPRQVDITSVADICCGTWNLLKAAADYFPQASIVGVDTEIASGDSCIDRAKFYATDGREFACKMEKRGVQYDLILSNPPFGWLTAEQKKFEGDENALLNSKRYEAELLYANYKLLRDNGYLVIILPITYARGAQYQEHRMWIAANFDVLNIIELPPDTFGTKSLNTVALLLKKTKIHENHMSHAMCAYQKNETWTIAANSVISRANIASGNWFSTYQAPISKVQLYRGNISSHYFSEDGMPVLHCSSVVNQGAWIPSVRKCQGVEQISPKYAESGDIVINRIGKHAAYWCVYTGEKCLVSDCLMVVKQPDEPLKKRFEKFSKNGALQVPKLGVSTPYISAKDIIALINAV